MNKELTAMQMLIEAMKKDYKSIEKDSSTTEMYIREEIQMRIQQAKYLIKKEQEQIEKAYEDGTASLSAMSGKRYYKSKFGGEDVDR